MNARQSLLLSLAAFAIAAPGLSSASSLYHSAGGQGYTVYPDHVKSSKTRNDVLQEVEVARKDGSLALYQRSVSVPVKTAGPGKTRAQVRQENLNMSASEKQKMQETYVAGV